MSGEISSVGLRSQSFCKKELHLKMCKKIADLTRVVDKLFRQYYEQNILFSSLQKRYRLQEKEKERLGQEKSVALKKIEGCKEEIQGLNKDNLQLDEQVDMLKRQITDTKAEKARALRENEQLKETLREVRNQMDEMHYKLHELCEQKTTCSGHVEVIDSLQKQVYKQSCEFDQLLKDKQHEESNYAHLQNQYKLVTEECVLLRSNLEEYESTVDSLQGEKRNLQDQIAQLLKEIHEHKNNHRLEIKRVASISKKQAPILQQRREYWLQKTPKEQDREVEKLKEELKRCRLELMNRESNFNRMFTDHTPIHMKPRPIGSTADESHSIHLPRLQTNSSQRSLRPGQ